MYRRLEQIGNAGKAGFTCERRRDAFEVDELDFVDDDMPLAKRITAARLHFWSLPHANAASDLPSHDGFAELLGELHELSVISPAIVAGQSPRAHGRRIVNSSSSPSCPAHSDAR